MSMRGNSKLTHNGYEYTKKKITTTTTIWECDKRRWNFCRGKAYTRQIHQKQMIKLKGSHNHPSNEVTK